MPWGTSASLMNVCVVAYQGSLMFDVKSTSVKSYENASSPMGACTLVPYALGKPTTATSFTSRAARKTVSGTIVSPNRMRETHTRSQNNKHWIREGPHRLLAEDNQVHDTQVYRLFETSPRTCPPRAPHGSRRPACARRGPPTRLSSLQPCTRLECTGFFAVLGHASPARLPELAYARQRHQPRQRWCMQSMMLHQHPSSTRRYPPRAMTLRTPSLRRQTKHW